MGKKKNKKKSSKLPPQIQEPEPPAPESEVIKDGEHQEGNDCEANTKAEVCASAYCSITMYQLGVSRYVPVCFCLYLYTF